TGNRPGRPRTRRESCTPVPDAGVRALRLRAGTCGPFPPRYGRTRLEVITGRQEVPHVPHHRGRPGRFAREQGRGRVGGPRGPAARSSAAPAARPRAGGGGRGRLAAPGKLTRGRSLERAERGGRGAAAAAHRRRG